MRYERLLSGYLRGSANVSSPEMFAQYGSCRDPLYCSIRSVCREAIEAKEEGGAARRFMIAETSHKGRAAPKTHTLAGRPTAALRLVIADTGLDRELFHEARAPHGVYKMPEQPMSRNAFIAKSRYPAYAAQGIPVAPGRSLNSPPACGSLAKALAESEMRAVVTYSSFSHAPPKAHEVTCDVGIG